MYDELIWIIIEYETVSDFRTFDPSCHSHLVITPSSPISIPWFYYSCEIFRAFR